MKRFVSLIVTLVLLGLTAACSKTGTVTKIYDGDTIRVVKEKVRLIGINSPEMEWKERGKKEECFAKQSSEYLKNRLLNKKVRLIKDKKSAERDRFGRRLAYVYMGQELINAHLVQEGYALAYTKFPFEKSGEFSRWQTLARRAGKGLWRVCKVECNGSRCRIRGSK